MNTETKPKAHLPRFRCRKYHCGHFYGVWDTAKGKYAPRCTRLGLAEAMRKAKEMNNRHANFGE